MGLFEKDNICLCQHGRRIIIEKGRNYSFITEYRIPMLLQIRDKGGSLFLNIDGLGELIVEVSAVEPDEAGIRITGEFHGEQDKATTVLTIPFNAIIDYNGQHGWFTV